MSHSVWDNDEAYQDFLKWVHHSCEPGLLDPAQWDPHSNTNPKILPWSALDEYFRANNYSRLKKLLRAALPGREIHDPDTIAKKCPQVFCILLLIGKPEYIERFAQRDHLQDIHLPFNANVEDFPKCPADQDPDKFLRRFREKQWMICAPKIHFQVNRELHDARILPLSIKKRLGSGVSATLYEVEIYPGYNDFGPSSAGDALQVSNFHPHTVNHLVSNRWLSLQMSNDRSANTFVLKTYTGNNAEQFYNREVRAYCAFQKPKVSASNPGMIRFYGSFKQQGRFNVLLEFADVGTLEHYFKTISRPKTGEDIINFWAQMFELIGAVKCIHHEGQMDGKDGQPQLLRG